MAGVVAIVALLSLFPARALASPHFRQIQNPNSTISGWNSSTITSDASSSVTSSWSTANWWNDTTSFSCISANASLAFSFVTNVTVTDTTTLTRTGTGIEFGTTTLHPIFTTTEQVCIPEALSTFGPGPTHTAPPPPVQQSTSTIIVTAKTPVIVVVPPSQPPNFGPDPTQSVPTAPTRNPPDNLNPNPPAGEPESGHGPSPTNLPVIDPNQPSRPGSNLPLPPTVGDFIASVIGGIRDSVDQGGIRGGGSKSGGSSTVVNGIPVQAEPHDVVIAGQTFSNPGPTPVVENVGGQTFTVLPNDGGVIVPGGQTITPAGSAPTPGVSAFSTTVVDGIPVTIGASEIIVSGSTFAVGAGTTPRIITIGSETITIGGTAGAIFPSVTVPPLSFQGSPMTTTIDGVVITIEPSDAIISGITYAFSAPTSVVINGETISIGPNGVGFPTTTIPVPAPTIQSGGAAFNPPITKLWTATIVAIVTALAYI